MKRKVGIVGFGHLGQYLVKSIEQHANFEIGFVWNRTKSSLIGKVKPDFILEDLSQFHLRSCDLIVEVADPSVTVNFGPQFLKYSDFMVGSPTAFADSAVEKTLREAAELAGHSLYIPAGALWGIHDIKKMADNHTLKRLKVTMAKHPNSLKLHGDLYTKNQEVSNSALILYEGPVRDLCAKAPNNVNTMAAAAIAAHNLGFDHVQGCLISDPSLTNWHIVEIEATGSGTNNCEFTVKTVRKNPANIGAVTGSATYESFFSSLRGATGHGRGIHFC